jgi:micrococcal nuclease
MTMYEYNAVVTNVVDGDTFDADVDLGFRAWIRGLRFRVRHINAPEMHGPSLAAGRAATDFAVGLLRGGPDWPGRVTMRTEKTDDFGRWLAEVTLPDGRDFGAAMIGAGHAVPYEGPHPHGARVVLDDD